MRSSLLQLITRNWPIKGAALFLALMLYVAVQLQQPVTTSFDVTLNVLLPRGRTLVHKPPKVRVQISGKGSQILKLRSLAGDITRQRAQLENLAALAGNLDTDLRRLVHERASPRQQHVQRHVEARRDGLLQLDGDVEHQRQEQGRALDGPVAGDQLQQATSHSAAAGSAFRCHPYPNPLHR